MQSTSKPAVDMSLCIGNVQLMLEKCRKVLDKKTFARLKSRVNDAQTYLKKKDVFKEYVLIKVK